MSCSFLYNVPEHNACLSKPLNKMYHKEGAKTRYSNTYFFLLLGNIIKQWHRYADTAENIPGIIALFYVSITPETSLNVYYQTISSNITLYSEHLNRYTAQHTTQIFKKCLFPLAQHSHHQYHPHPPSSNLKHCHLSRPGLAPVAPGSRGNTNRTGSRRSWG